MALPNYRFALGFIGAALMYATLFFAATHAHAQVFKLNQLASSTQAVPYFGVLMGDGFPTHIATASSSPTVGWLTATSTTGTTTLPRVTISTGLSIFGTYAQALSDLCVAITGGSGLCDGTDATGAGGTGVGTVATSSLEVLGQLPYWTSSSAYPATLGGVATTTLTATLPLSLSNTVVKVGGSNSVLTIATTTTSLFTGSLGQVLAYTGNGWTGVATSTLATITGTLTADKGGTGSTTLSGILKGNGTSAIQTAVNGTDYTLITAKDCTGTGHVLSVTAAGVFTCSADTGGGGSGTGNVATSTHEVLGQIPVFSSNSATPATIMGTSTFLFSTSGGGSNNTFDIFDPARLSYVEISNDSGGGGSAQLSIAGGGGSLVFYGGTVATSWLIQAYNGATQDINLGPNASGGSYIKSENNLAIGTSTPYAALSVWGRGTTASTKAFEVANNASSTLLAITNAGNVGVGTTTPGTLFSIDSVANFRTATSAFSSTGGINLAGGCFAINGTCVGGGGGSGTVTSITGGLGLNGGTITTSGTLSLISYLATSSVPSVGGLAYWTGAGTPSTLGTVGTTTITLPSYITYSGTLGSVVGGASGNLAISQLPVANGGTNATSFSGFSLIASNADGTALTATSTNPLYVGSLFATTTTATSTFLGLLRVATTSATAFTIDDGFGTNIFKLNTASTTGNILQVMASTTSAILFAIDQLGMLSASSTSPTVSSGTIDGTNNGGIVAGCSSACTITFANGGWPKIPECTASPDTGSVVNTFSYVRSKTTLVVTETGLGTFNFHCGVGL